MSCDIIIPIWNNLLYTKECIEHIVKNTHYPYRLILVDNASDDETRRYLESVRASARPKAMERIELIRNVENLGFIKAVNQAMAISKAPYICVLNNDTLPAPGWLERMVEFAENHKDVGLMNPLCDGHLDKTIEEHARSLALKNKGIYMEMNQCQGFCMLVKREVIDKIGYLDESFGIGGFDDTDYSMRAHIAGYRCVAIYDAYVYHRLHASFDKAGNREEWVRRNEKIYYDKWGKHLRVGVAVDLKGAGGYDRSHLLPFAYGLAREWTWVHMWLNSTKRESLEGAPLHQNIRIDYLDLPGLIFSAVLSGKILERMRRRMREKKFDALIVIGNAPGALLRASARAVKIPVINIPVDYRGDWQEKGREIALYLKDLRKKNG